MAEALARLLYLEGLSADWAGTGSLGLRLVETVDPDLVLLDALMTGPDGSAVGPVLRARSGVPIILFSSSANGDGDVRGIVAGADAQIAWPFSAPDVQAAVRRVLKQRSDEPAVIYLRDEQPTRVAAPSTRPPHGGRRTGHGHIQHRRGVTRTGA